MYENFNAPSTKSLDSIFNRLLKIVIQLAILGENISQEDLNLKFLRSLPFEWNTHVVVWRNKLDLDTMSIDDLYNNFKIVEQEVKITVISSSNLNLSSKNMAFVSSPSSTNEVNTANVQVSTANSLVSTADTLDSTANLSDATVYAFLANQPNGTQLVHEDLEQIHEDDREEIDLKWQLALLSLRARRGPRNQDNRNRNQDSSRRTMNVEETSFKAMVAIDGASFDWIFMADEEVPTNMTLMAFSDSEIYNDKTYTSFKDSEINTFKSEIEKLKKEKESNQIKIENFKNASKSLDKLIRRQISNNSRKGVGFVSYNVVPPPPTGLFAPPTIDLSNSSLEEFQQPEFEGYGPKASKSVYKDIFNEVNKTPDAPLGEKLMSYKEKAKYFLLTKDRSVIQQEKPVRKIIGGDFVMYNKACFVCGSFDHVQTHCNYHQREGMVNENTYTRVHPQKEDQGYVDSGCSRHMTGNMSYLTDFKEFDVGYPLSFIDTLWVSMLPSLNTLDHLGKFDGKSDDGFFVGYLLTSTNSNDFAGSEESNDAGHTSKETEFSQDYIMMPLWKDGLMFDSSSKNSSNDEPQPSINTKNKDDDDVSKASGFSDQEKPESSTPNINTDGPSINTASANFKTGSLNINTVSPTVITTRSNRSQNVSDMFSFGGSATLEATLADLFGDETEIDMSNLTISYQVPTTLNTRIHKYHSLDHVIGDIQSGVQTRGMTKNTNEHGFISAVYEGKIHEDLHTCLFACFLSHEEPKRIAKALSDPAWRAIGTKWIFRNKKDERGIVTRNKVRLVAQGYTQEEGIDYDEVFAPVARIKTIRLLLAYASFMGFMVYQIDVKSAFLYGTIEEEVYMCQPPGFEDPDYPDKVYKVVKALYGLHQAPRAWYGTLAKYLLDNRFQRGKIDQPYLSRSRKEIFFLFSSMGELNFFLGLQVKQKEDGIFISQDKFVAEILKKFGFTDVKTASIPMDTEKPLLKDLDGDDVDVRLYRSMIRSLMYLTSSRPDIMFACKKQTVVATSSTEAEYVAAASCCGQALREDYLCQYTVKAWMEGYVISKESKTSRHVKKGRDTKIPQSSGPPIKVGDEVVHKELGDRMERAATTASSLEAEQDNDRVLPFLRMMKQTKKTYGATFTKLIKKVKTLEKTIKSSKARRRAQFVVSDDEEEDYFNQGRKIAEIDEDL
ncbi:putative ribonuclease H-like domain-containing protein [Tanacetum coccineum]|uniref:Ribonuclease H-like domain-containing protein n=1 Tax=Tanacetum coccineum TaxID=301880 RepID=A0ABQ4Y789_9ASTR